MTKRLAFTDSTLRDGQHAVRHRLTREDITSYCTAADAAGLAVVEVGHGNGLGASSFHIGEAALRDDEMLVAARQSLKRTKLGVLLMPGYATIARELEAALEAGVDVVRVACHCTEADLTERYIRYVKRHRREACGVLVMSHMATEEKLVQQALLMESYGAQSVVIMDSSGHYLPQDVRNRISALTSALAIPVGFHAHNNLGMAIANSVAAAEAGAQIIDGTARGFGAGAGNAQIEVLAAVTERLGYSTGIELYRLLDACDLAEKQFIKSLPAIRTINLISGLAGVFSGFSKPTEQVADQFGVDSRDLMFELGKRKMVAGQEDLIPRVASELADRSGIRKKTDA